MGTEFANATQVTHAVMARCSACAGAVHVSNDGLGCALEPPVACVLLELERRCRAEEREGGLMPARERVTREWIDGHAQVVGDLDTELGLAGSGKPDRSDKPDKPEKSDKGQ